MASTSAPHFNPHEDKYKVVLNNHGQPDHVVVFYRRPTPLLAYLGEPIAPNAPLQHAPSRHRGPLWIIKFVFQAWLLSLVISFIFWMLNI
jgi:hypothetical protein